MNEATENAINAISEAAHAAREEAKGPSIGSIERPYVFMLPAWQARIVEIEKGMTAQEYADEIFDVTVEVRVV